MNHCLDLSVVDLSKKLSDRSLSSVELTQASLARMDETEGRLNAFISRMDESALAAAKKSDEERSPKSSMLSGIPIGIKDVLSTKGHVTTSGSKIMERFVPPYNATVVERILNAGGVIVGKSNCDEFAMGSSNENSAYGDCFNPWDVTCVPGGSSGGSAVNVAARQTLLSVGTDTGGSIRQPAALCGVVGMKSTYGRVSRFGITAFASSLDQAGPFGKTVEDISILFDVMAGYDPKDSTSINQPSPHTFQKLSSDIKGLKIGIPKEYLREDLPSEIQENFEQSLNVLKKCGAMVMPISLPHTDYATACYYIVASAEASSNLARYDGIRYTTRHGQDRGLNQIYLDSRSKGFGEEVQRRILLGTFVLSAGYYDAFYIKALRVREAIKNDFKEAFKLVNAIATPTTPSEAFKLRSHAMDPMQMYLADIFTVSTPLSGNPALSIPSGFSKNNLPLGLQLIGPHMDEQIILNTALAFQNETQFFKKAPPL